MPTYWTTCSDCKHEEQVVHSITEDHPPCSECGGTTNTFIPMGTILPASMSNQRKQYLEERRTIKQLNRE